MFFEILSTAASRKQACYTNVLDYLMIARIFSFHGTFSAEQTELS